MVRTTLGAEVETTVTVSGSETVDFISEGFSSSVASGDNQLITIRPPAGFIYELRAFNFFALNPASSGATTGTHQMRLKSESKQVTVLTLEASHNKLLRYQNGHAADADVSENPPATTAQTNVVKGLRAGAQNGYQIEYKNRTDSSTSELRRVKLWVRQIEVAQ